MTGRKIFARALEIAREIGLVVVPPHALFIAIYERSKTDVDTALKAAGVDPVKYCQKVAEEINSLPRSRNLGVLPFCRELYDVLSEAGGWECDVHSLISALLEADEIVAESESRRRGDTPPYQMDDARRKECGDPFADLEALIGLDNVKDEVKKLVELVKFNQARQKAGLPNESPTSHLVFSGNPGTGKTTIARILARIYKKLGVLKKGHLVEVDRSKLVAGYVGQTAIQTNAVIDSALNGVLFIDEAYSLAGSGAADYGHEAIATLLKRMEDQRNRLVVIVAGYEDEMNQFVNSNPGLQSRFTKYIHFPDYTAEEMARIFMAMAAVQGYECSEATQKAVRARMAMAASKGGRAAGNARFVRNLFSATKERMAMRVMADGVAAENELQLIAPEDLG